MADYEVMGIMVGVTVMMRKRMVVLMWVIMITDKSDNDKEHNGIEDDGIDVGDNYD